jgi:hypothetical protein
LAYTEKGPRLLSVKTQKNWAYCNKMIGFEIEFQANEFYKPLIINKPISFTAKSAQIFPKSTTCIQVDL